MEAVLLLATIAQRFCLIVQKDQKVLLQPSITLRPKYGLKMLLRLARLYKRAVLQYPRPLLGSRVTEESILGLRRFHEDFRSDPLYLSCTSKGRRQEPSSRRLLIFRCSSPSRLQALLGTLSGINTFKSLREQKKRVNESFIPSTFSHWN